MMKNGYKHSAGMLLFLGIMVAMLAGCGKAPAAQETNLQSYITVGSAALPEEVIKVRRFLVQNDKAYICTQVRNGDEVSSCISTMGLDMNGYRQLTEALDASYDIRDFAIDAGGNIWAVCSVNSKTASLLQFGADGVLCQSIDLTSNMQGGIKISDDTGLFINIDVSGNIFVAVKAAKTYVYVFDKQGQYLFGAEDNSNLLCVVTAAEGDVVFCVSDGTTSCRLLTIDQNARGWSENRIELGTVYGIYGGASHSFYIYDSSDFYSYTTETQSKELIFNWADLGLSTGDVHVCELSDGRFAAITGAFSQTGLYSYDLTLIEPGKDERTILTMSSIQPDESVVEAVAQFNKSSQKYKVELTQYFSSYEEVSDEDLDNAIEKFNLDITSGNIPDIIDLSNMPIEIYTKKGILEDLYSYINTDPDINMEDYFENILDAFSIDGRLPYVTNGVMIATFFADSRILGTEAGWTYDDVLSLLEQYKLDGLNSEFFLEKAIQSSDSLVDWSAGECYFESDEFIQLLELAAKVGNKNGNAFSGETKDKSVSAIYNITFSVYDIAQFFDIFEGNVNAIGLPNDHGTDYQAVLPGAKIGMSAAGRNKEGAWSFVRTFLEERQQDSSYFFPIRKASFDKLMKEAMNGNSIWSYRYEGKITQQEVELAKALLSSAHYSFSDNTTIIDIATEEAEAYFDGSRTAKEVAANIQTRVQLYINEQR